jgi:hypothetical protein
MEAAAVNSGPLQYVGGTGGAAQAIAINGTLAYLGEGGGLTILDISNPASPQRLGHFQTSEYVQSVQVTGNRAYIAADHAGLLILDVTNSASPMLLGSYDTGGHAVDVQVVGTRAYVISNGPQSGMQIVDVSDPAAPHLLGRLSLFYGASRVQVVNDIAYIAANYPDMLVTVDVSNPASPRRLSNSLQLLESVTDVQVMGNRAYVISDDYEDFAILNVTDPAGPLPVTGAYDIPGKAKAVSVLNGRAYVTNTGGSIFILDVTDPTKPGLLGSYNSPGSSPDLQVVDGRAYLADGPGGLQIVDVRNAANPALLGTFLTWPAYRVHANGHRAYIAAGTAGLQIVDASDPANPAWLGGFSTSGPAKDVQVVNNRAFIANSGIWNGSGYVGGGLQIVDIADPRHPTLLGSYSLEYAQGVQVENSIAYIAAFDGFYILNVSDPANPTLLGGDTSLRGLYDVDVVNNHAYVSFDNVESGLAIFAVSNAVRPTLLGRYTLSKARSVDVVGSVAYVTDGDVLRILDVTDPGNIKPLGLYKSSPHTFTYAQVVGNLAFITEIPDGVEVVDLADPANPRTIASNHTTPQAYSLQVIDDLVYVANGDGGLRILRFDAQATTTPATPTSTSTTVPSATPTSTLSNLPPATSTSVPTSTPTMTATVSNGRRTVFLPLVTR